MCIGKRSRKGVFVARKKESTQPRLVAYYRYSGGSRQTKQSIEGQRRDCEAYARAHGMTILREYVDRHISGKTDDRAQFRQMIDDSAKRTFDLVICWKTDRFARNRDDSAVYKKQLRDNGVSVIYAAESNIEGAEGIIIEGLMEALAEYYSAELAEKARRGMRESALKGQTLGRTPPLGLTVDSAKHYVIDPAGADTVRLIFELYASGLSIASIIRRLNGMGLRTVRGNPFDKSSISRIICDERYRGVYVSKKFDVRIEGAIPPIIDDDLWERTQKNDQTQPSEPCSPLSQGRLYPLRQAVLRRMRLPDEGHLRPQPLWPRLSLLFLPGPQPWPPLYPEKYAEGCAEKARSGVHFQAAAPAGKHPAACRRHRELAVGRGVPPRSGACSPGAGAC